MIITNQEYKKFTLPIEKKSHDGLDRLVHLGMGKVYKKIILRKRLNEIAKNIYNNSKQHAMLSDEELTKIILKYKRMYKLSKIDDEGIYDSISSICEVCFRIFGYRPYYEQIMGALGQYYGFAIQMLPGEGKTITAAISGVMAGWTGKPCHIITSNDYLASRDAEIMTSFYNGCLLSVGYVVGEMKDEQRIENYKCNVVYATSKELVADFLRDQISDKKINDFDNFIFNKLFNGVSSGKPRVMQGIHTAIVDEADSVLADEALTPLVISESSDNEVLKEAIYCIFELIEKFKNTIHYKVEEEFKDVSLTNEGKILLDNLNEEFPVIWRTYERKTFLLIQALSAKELYINGRDYIIDEENKIVLVDEKTGRLMPGKSLSAGLHQAIEAKEKLELSNPTKTNIKMSFQRFFRLYTKLSGMSGTLQNIENELWSIYELPVIEIPKRIANTYILKPIEIFENIDLKIQAIINEIIEVNKRGQAILVGTTSINESERLSNILKSKGIICTTLNAKHHKEEDQIVAEAGYYKSIVISTNIAGRGTDIKITEEMEKLGGLHVIATQLADSKRVDLQLFGRTSRQGQKGSVKVFLSLDDKLINKKIPKKIFHYLKKNIHKKYIKRISILLYKFSQKSEENKSSKLRLKMLQKDYDFSKKLSFTKTL
ncbi:MAG: helicase-related protein [Poseidonibacter sp.]|uniref:preprotein translocase subunit SecA n=1 Tax=Poseidonibacter sp. TaxID=2321188 RepID=UPI00359DA036